MCPSDPETTENNMSHFPEAREEDAKNGLYCFLNADRVCGADCMAYATERPKEPEYLGQWSACMLLQTAHRGAKHLVVLASVVVQMSNQAKKAADDAARKTTPPPVTRL